MVISRNDNYVKNIEMLLISYVVHFKADLSSISEIKNTEYMLYNMRI